MVASRYRIARLIERGGTAEVFEAYIVGEHGFERRVALKKLREEVLSEEGFVEHFIDEARIAAQLHHVNVVSVFDFGVMDGIPFLVLEYVDGLDLVRLEQRSPLTPEVALAIALDVARGLSYAHKAKDARGGPLRIVHRDVSPGNVLISYTGDVKISDFGIALAVERLGQTRVGYAKGKLSFMAPEQMNGTATDARADLFALGCLLHWMVLGKSPIDREEARETVRRGGDVAISKELDRDLGAIVLRATRTDPNRRYRTADEMANEIGAAVMKRSIDRDFRAILAEFMSELAPAREPVTRSPLAEMMDVELVLEESLEPLRRFESVVVEGQTTLAKFDPEELESDHQDTTEPSISAEIPVASVVEEKATAPQDKLLGSILHGYRLMQLLGHGSVARVYRAQHLVLDREYAVKVLFTRSGETNRGKLRMQREAQALSKLTHPNVVQVFDFGFTDDGRPFLTMELLRGETLKQVITREGKLEPSRAASITRQLAEGLESAHQAGLVHRDLKPSNVMLVEGDGKEIAKILDFGIVRAITAGTRITASDQLLGTPRYMAPEQIRGASNVGPSADIYALGAVLYAMLSGKPPFTGSTIEVIERQLSEKPKPLETGTPLDDLAQWLLGKTPEERPASAERIVTWLENAGYKEEVTATTVLPPEPPPSRTAVVNVERRGPSRLLVPALFALLVAVIALALALWWPKERSSSPVQAPITIPTKAPVVIARPEAQPPPPQVEAQPPPPPVKTPPAPRKAKQTKVTKRPESPHEIDKQVRTAMRKRGLSRRDLISNPDMQALLASFESEGDPEAQKRVGDRLVDAIGDFAIDEGLVKAKLDRVAKSLSTAAGKLDQAVLDRLENQYLDLRSSFREGLSSSELTALMIRTDTLERELNAAMN